MFCSGLDEIDGQVILSELFGESDIEPLVRVIERFGRHETHIFLGARRAENQVEVYAGSRVSGLAGAVVPGR